MRTETALSRRIARISTVVALVVASTVFLTLSLLTASGGDLKKSLGGEMRYRTHLSTDKPIYRVGEKVYLRGVLLDAHYRTPNSETSQAQVQIRSPKGDVVYSVMCRVQDSVLGASWKVPEGLSGGVYTARVSYPHFGHAPTERKFEIRVYRAPRLSTRIEFARKGYGEGDRVVAALEVRRAEGGVPAGAKGTVIARLDGREVHRAPFKIDSKGVATVAFELPEQIETGEGTLSLVIEDGGVVETASKTIPILLKSIRLAAYPEGGDLVVGLENRIYVEAATPWGDPADVTAIVVDGSGRTVATFETTHEGRGKGSFTPVAGQTYTLRVTKPMGIETTVALPTAREKGVVLSTPGEIHEAGGSVVFELAATAAGKYRVLLSKIERLVGETTVVVEAGGKVEASIEPTATAEGVLRLTVLDPKGIPSAERLVFRRSARTLSIEIETAREAHVPGDPVELRIRTTDGEGRPVPAVVGLTVTDRSVLEMIERRERAPRLPAMVLLEDEVDHLDDAWIYLSDDEGASAAVDLLLGTQGWRRFALVDPGAFLKTHGEAARRVLAHRVKPQREAFDDMAEEAPLRLNRPADKPMKAQEEPRQNEAKKDLVEGQFKMAGRRILRGRLKQRFAKPLQRMVQVRIYAHRRTAGEGRHDFTETVYWAAGVRTDAQGKATVKFQLSDSVTSFVVAADGFAADGRLGSADATIEAVRPFYVEPKLPLEVTTGDAIELPVTLVNGTREALDYELRIEAGGKIGVGAFEVAGRLAAEERARVVVPLAVGAQTGEFEIVVHARAGRHSDRVIRTLRVVPAGFPILWSAGGRLEGEGEIFGITIPKERRIGSFQATATVYPTPLANLTEALAVLMREPHGCFEQTSSTNYPLVMAQQYFLTHSGVDPALVARARKLLDKGYKRLVGYECSEGGYEWFGGNPGHEALTAYGVLEFIDMAQVYPVDREMLQRSKDWLLARRDGKGGFLRNSRALDSFGGAPPEITNAYIVWSLTEAGQKGLEKEVDALARQAATSKDPYFIGLVAGSLHNVGRLEDSRSLASRLVAFQNAKGHLDGAKTTITRSGGDALLIETTSVAVLAWLDHPQHAGRVERAMTWLAGRCKQGRFGSTQSTILALKAIIAYDASRTRPKESGVVRIEVDGVVVGQVPFSSDQQGPIELPEFSELLLEPGRHAIRLVMTDGSAMPYAVSVEYTTSRPATTEACPVEVETRLATKRIGEGEGTEVEVNIRNRTDQGQPMTLAVVGLPGGLEPRHQKLKELVRAGTVDAYEVNGREVIFYLRDMAPSQTISLRLDCIAAIPGRYEGPASRAYLYYTDEEKRWVGGLSVQIDPKR